MTTLTVQEYQAVCQVVDRGDPRLATQCQCSICMSDFSDDPSLELREIQHCRHIFHDVCLREWLTQGSKTCPLCRGQALLQEDRTSLVFEPMVMYVDTRTDPLLFTPYHSFWESPGLVQRMGRVARPLRPEVVERIYIIRHASSDPQRDVDFNTF